MQKKQLVFKKIIVVIGGFHVKTQNRQALETIKYFKTNKVEKLIPSHRTELPALTAFHAKFNILQVKTGLILEF